MIIAPHLGGSIVRVHLSNRFGSAPVTLGPVTIGVAGPRAALVAGSTRSVTFTGTGSITIPAGQDAISDPVALSVRGFQDLAISVYVAGPLRSPTEHWITRQTSYLTPPNSGDHSADANGAAFTQKTTTSLSNGWYFLDGLDAQAPGDTGALVTFGDSITDGLQVNLSAVNEQLATIDTNGRYPDDLARRLISAGIPLSVLNAGISGNRLLQAAPMFGASGISRFKLDAIAQGGVSDVIVLEGINDIVATLGLTAQDLIAGYGRLIAQAHGAGIRIQLGTLTPAGGTGGPTYGGAAAQQLRQQVNQWIRTQHLADGVIDFDAAVRDPQNPSQINPPSDGSDHLHFSLAGYRAMADAVRLTQLRAPDCRRPCRYCRSWSPRAPLPPAESSLCGFASPAPGAAGLARPSGCA
jgi:lysophospholipase L1-like esterase